MGKSNYRKLWIKRNTTNKENADNTSYPSRSSRCHSKSPPVMHVQLSGQPLYNTDSALSSFSYFTSVKSHSCDMCYYPNHFASRCPFLANPRFAYLMIICLASTQKPMYKYPLIAQKTSANQNNRFCGRKPPRFSSSRSQTRVLQTE